MIFEELKLYFCNWLIKSICDDIVRKISLKITENGVLLLLRDYGNRAVCCSV